jgi:diguanylate cyclase (GGDEF)-like protein
MEVAALSRVVDEVPRLRRLLRGGRSAEAVVLADRILEATDDPLIVADTMLHRLAGLVNLGRKTDYTPALDVASSRVVELSEPRLNGRLHALAAIIAHLDDSIDRCVTHLVISDREMNRVELADDDIACAWHDLAMAYSYVGFHGHAISAMDRSREVARRAGVSESSFITPAIRVRLAVWYDQNGDTDGCCRILRDVRNDLDWHRKLEPSGLESIRPISRGAYGYAITRLAALGEPVDGDSRSLLESAGQSLRARDLRMLGEICRSIEIGDTNTALSLLDHATIAPATMGPAETHRLRALAYLAAGSYPEAYTADRRAHRVASAQSERVRELLVDGVKARLDHEDMRRSVDRLQGEALTDSLTGLPNRRHLERHINELVRDGNTAFLGVCDLDGFKRVNTVHGHLSGDMVLQRVAGILMRVTRQGDFVARFGGDEFVIVLPSTGRSKANEIAHRIVAAINEEDWSSLVPGTPVGATVGWAEVTGIAGIEDAFNAADRAMLRRKAS